ncbi:MAG: hypothetical protein IPI41_18930 [Flavobacteriales bacterium]|nr:hypothetical protein [Flavobacteriales bacterium]
MKRPILRYVFAAVLLLFGALTLFLSTSVIFDLFGVRAREGNYVLVVVWANFIASISYMLAAAGVIAQRRWPAKVLLAAVVVLVGAAVVSPGMYTAVGSTNRRPSAHWLSNAPHRGLLLRCRSTRQHRTHTEPTPYTMTNTGLLTTALVGCTLLALGCGTDTPRITTIRMRIRRCAGHRRSGKRCSRRAPGRHRQPLDRQPGDHHGHREHVGDRLKRSIVASGNADTLKAALEEEFGLIFRAVYHGGKPTTSCTTT